MKVKAGQLITLENGYSYYVTDSVGCLRIEQIGRENGKIYW